MTEKPWYARPGSDRRARDKAAVERMQRERSRVPPSPKPPLWLPPPPPRRQTDRELLAEYLGLIVLLWSVGLLAIGIIVEIAS